MSDEGKWNFTDDEWRAAAIEAEAKFGADGKSRWPFFWMVVAVAVAAVMISEAVTGHRPAPFFSFEMKSSEKAKP